MYHTKLILEAYNISNINVVSSGQHALTDTGGC